MVITMSGKNQLILQNSRLSRAAALAREIEEEISAGVLNTGDRLRTEADIRALRSILASMTAHLDQPRAYARYNTAFHRRIAKLSPNAPLRSMYVTLLDFFENDLAVENLPDTVHPDNIDVHRQLVDAIEQGDLPEPELAIRRHGRHRRN